MAAQRCCVLLSCSISFLFICTAWHVLASVCCTCGHRSQVLEHAIETVAMEQCLLLCQEAEPFLSARALRNVLVHQARNTREFAPTTTLLTGLITGDERQTGTLKHTALKHTLSEDASMCLSKTFL
jgi:hypothetical protein